MSERCFPVEDLDEVVASPPGDPRRRHADGCPRCRGLIVSYKRFMSGAGLPPELDVSETDARLAEAVDREIFGPARPRPSPSRDFLETLRGRLSVRVAVAALALAVVVIMGIREASHLMPGDRDHIVLRQAPRTSHAAIAAEVEATGTGPWRFAWSPVEGADRYAVVLLGADLIERARFETGPETTFVVDAGELPARLEAEAAVLWRVVALRGQDEIAHSPTRLLPGR